MRLIDADELLKAVDEERKYLLARGQAGAEHILVHNFRNLVDNAPTVELRMGRMTNGIIIPIERPTGEYQKKALKLIDSMQDEKKITVRQVGTLRRAILTEPERQQGTWEQIRRFNKKGRIFLNCNQCNYGKNGEIICELPEIPNFCPNCGARMKGTEE